jgi:hypothetical protein
MKSIRAVGSFAILAFSLVSALADDITDAIEQAHKAYQSGDLANAKQSLDLASQPIGQKNAESLATPLPNPLPGWNAEKAQAQAQAMGAVVFGASVASRSYSNAQGENVEVQITGDSALVMQFAPLFANPQFAGAMGKIIKVGNQRAIQTSDGDVNMVVNNKFLVTVNGSAPAAAKLAYAQVVDVTKLAKM